VPTVPLTYVIPPEPLKQKDKSDEDKEKENLKVRMKDSQVKWMKSLDAEDRAKEGKVDWRNSWYKLLKAWELVGKSLLEIQKDDLKLLQLKLDIVSEAAEAANKKSEITDAERETNLKSIVDAADELMAHFSKPAEAGGTSDFFSYYGNKPKKPETKEQKKMDKKMKFAKGVLVGALKRKAEALKQLSELETSVVSVEEKEETAGDGFIEIAPGKWLEVFKKNWKELEKWAENLSSASEYNELGVWFAMATGKPGKALKLCQTGLKPKDKDSIPAAPSKKIYLRRLAILESMGWEHIVRAERNAIAARFPPNHGVF